MLGVAGFAFLGASTRNHAAARSTAGSGARLPGARLRALGPPPGPPSGLELASVLWGLARRTIDAGTLGYSIVAGRAR
jgi:hypothetical protein